MLFTGALLILFVVAIPASLGGLYLARSCYRRGVAKGIARIAWGLNVALAVMVLGAGAAIALGFEPRSGTWAIVTGVVVYLIPLSTIASVMLDVVLLSAKLAAGREAAGKPWGES